MTTMTTPDDPKGKEDSERIEEWNPPASAQGDKTLTDEKDTLAEAEQDATAEQESLAEWNDSKPTDAIPIEWVESQPTVVQMIADYEHQTAPHSIADMPGYEPGFADGRRRGVADALDALRIALIEVGLDTGESFKIAEKVGRRIGVHGS